MAKINLDDCEQPEGGGWLRSGQYEVRVASYEDFESGRNKTPGVRYWVECEQGKSKVEFWLTKKAKFRLRSFSIACGLNDEARQAFEFDDLIGCRVMVEVTPDSDDGKYHAVSDWWPVKEPAGVRGSSSGPPAETEPDDDIPF